MSRRLLLISNSGSPFLARFGAEIADFLGPIRRIGYLTAARMGDAEAVFEKARDALARHGITVDHLRHDDALAARIEAADAVFCSGGNTYALLDRLQASAAFDALAARVRTGMPYVGTSAGSNLAGPNILGTNDWNVVAARRFDAMAVVPWILNPHYLTADPAMAPGSETRDMRIAELLRAQPLPVLGIEEQTALRVENGRGLVVGDGRARLFTRHDPPRWFAAGETIPLPGAAAPSASAP